MKPNPGVRGDGVVNDGPQDRSAAGGAEELGAAPTIETPEKFAAFIAAEMRKWTEIATVAGIKVD